MFILGILFPILTLLLTKSPLHSLRGLRIFSSYLIVFSALQFIVDYFSFGIFTQYTMLFVLGFMEASNLEHVINNNANQNFVFIKFLFDPVFLKGSGITKRFFLRLTGIQALLGMVAWLHLSFDLKLSAAVFVLTILINLIFPQSSVLPDWLQENWLLFNLKNLLHLKKNKNSTHRREDVSLSHEKLALADENYTSLRPREAGEGRWLSASFQSNILLIVVEGLGEVHLKKGWLPKLAERRSKNVSFKRFINHQRNTNRGLYSLFTGKHPNLVDQMAKPDIVAQYGKMDTGVAEVLHLYGYKTVYLQGAPSVFMCKDRFLPILGFEEVIGEEKFPKEVPRIKWGVDDHELYKQSLFKIQELNASPNPWFLSLLTVTTHHPIEASNRVLKNLEDGFRYADDELDDFLNELDKMGVMQNTLICITSDEVAGDGQHVLAESLGTMVMLLPKTQKLEIETPFTQSDVAFSLCDYAQVENHPFLGRSFFRSYTSERPLYFASIFQQKSFLYEDRKLFIEHYSGKKEVLSLDDLTLESLVSSSKKYAEEGFKKLESFIHASDRGLEFLSSPIIMDLKEIRPTGEDVVKSPGFIKVGLKKGESVILKFQAENRNVDMPLVLNWLIQDMKYKRSFKPNTIVLPGADQSFEKTFTAPEDSWFDLSIRIMANGNNDWIITNLQIKPKS